MNEQAREKPGEHEILAVDDTPENLQLLTRILCDHGYRVRPAANGELALRSVAAKKPDLILLDVKMPGLDGLEVCRRLKAKESTRDIPVLFISGLGGGGDKSEGFLAGGLDYITKPFEPEEILARVGVHLRLHSLSQRLEKMVRERTRELQQALGRLEADMSARIQVEQALRASEERLRVIADNTCDWEYWRAQDGSHLWVSPACEKICGYAPKDFIGDNPMSMLHIIHPDDKHIWERHTKEVNNLSPEHCDLQVRIIKKSGEIVWISHVCKPIHSPDGVFLGRRGCNRDITAGKMAEQALRESETRLRDLVENAGDAIYLVDEQGRFLDVNSQATVQTGFSREELLGMGVADLDLDQPQDVFEALVASIGRQGAASFETRHRRKDGGHVPVELKVVWRDAAEGPRSIGIARDISRRKLAERALRESEERYRRIVDTALEGVLILDARHRLTYLNRRMAEMFGVEPAQALGRDVSDFIHPSQLSQHEAKMVERRQGNDQVYERAFVKSSGETLWALVSPRAIFDEQGSFAGSFAMLTDITARKRDEELREQIERTIRHDLRTSAISAMSLAGILRDETNLTQEQRGLVEIFERSGQNMLDTLNMSLTVYKIETGQYRCEPVEFDCLSVIEQIVAALTKKVQFAAVRLEIHVHGQAHGLGLRHPCLGEPALLRNALQNLLINAIEASPPGEEVVVELSAGADCRIEIRNQGVVPKDIRGRFFEKYATQGKKQGTGLGAYSAKMFIQAQNGSIEMHTSDLDNQTVVTLRLPC